MVVPDQAEAEATLLRLLVNQLRPSVRSTPNMLSSVLGHLASTVNGPAAVVTPDGRMVGRDGITSILQKAKNSPAVERVRTGELGAASLVLEGFYVQIAGMGECRPRPVILVARRTQFPTWMAGLVNSAAVALAASSQLSRGERVQQGLTQAMHAARAAVVAQLLAGQVQPARRLAEQVVPGLLDAPRARMIVIECGTGARAHVLDACQRPMAGKAVVAADLHCDDRVLIVAPIAEPHVDDARRLVKDLSIRAGCVAGESGPVALTRICDADEMASRALKVARRQPERFATYSGESQLAHLLADAARPWALAYLKPLGELPVLEQEALLDNARHVLQSGHGRAAEIAGLNRKTISSRWNRTARILGLDLDDMQVRAELDLALELVRATDRSAESAAPGLSIAEIIMAPIARKWACEFVAPLRGDSRSLLRTVTAWISVNGRIDECAARLEAHPNTIRNHLAACERILGRKLVGRAGGANDLVTALRILHQGATAEEG